MFVTVPLQMVAQLYVSIRTHCTQTPVVIGKAAKNTESPSSTVLQLPTGCCCDREINLLKNITLKNYELSELLESRLMWLPGRGCMKLLDGENVILLGFCTGELFSCHFVVIAS